jgi:hypothetical protein
VITATPNTIVARDTNASTAVNVLTVNTINATTVNATTFYGTLSGNSSGANTLLFNGVYVPASSSNTPSTIIARDASGNFAAGTFTGTSTRAQYADLAERYASDADYEPGTVVIFGGEKEITTTTQRADTRVAGAVSTAPAYLMNDVSNEPPVALRGKIPVKVIGSVKKGDPLITSSIAGYAEVGDLSTVSPVAIFAKSLENKEDLDPGVVMAVVL